MFGIVVSFVVFAGCPVEVELSLGDSVFEPVVKHIKSFGSFHSKLRAKNVVGSGVVGFERRAIYWLLVAQFFKSSDHGNSILSAEEKSAGFSFGSRGRDTFECLAENVDGAIVFRIWRIAGDLVREKK